MAKHRKSDLLQKVVEAVHESGWNVLYASSPSEHPFLLRVYSGEQSYLVRIYIWNLTHGGGKNRPKDEYRVQVTGVEKFLQLPGERTLILGWWDEVGVFAGFDYHKHSGKLGYSPSIQIREVHLRRAYENGFSAGDKGNGEVAVAFSPDFLVQYIQSLNGLHALGEAPAHVEIMEQVASGAVDVNDAVVEAMPDQRKQVIRTVKQRQRSSSFQRRVLSAYKDRCAFSGMQLGLVDAAHILPVEVETSTDTTSNGIALSTLYHRAYDWKMVTFNEQYQIVVNPTEMKRLKEIGFDGGMNDFIKMLRPLIHVPADKKDRPNVKYVSEANKQRGWTDLEMKNILH